MKNQYQFTFFVDEDENGELTPSDQVDLARVQGEEIEQIGIVRDEHPVAAGPVRSCLIELARDCPDIDKYRVHLEQTGAPFRVHRCKSPGGHSHEMDTSPAGCKKPEQRGRQVLLERVVDRDPDPLS